MLLLTMLAGLASRRPELELPGFLATYAGMTTLMRAPVGAILAAAEGEAIMREMLAECFATAKASDRVPGSAG